MFGEPTRWGVSPFHAIVYLDNLPAWGGRSRNYSGFPAQDRESCRPEENSNRAGMKKKKPIDVSLYSRSLMHNQTDERYNRWIFVESIVRIIDE